MATRTDDTQPAGGEVRLLSSLAVIAVVKELLPLFEREQGVRVAADYAPTNVLRERLATGEACDAVIMTADGVDALIAAGAAMAGGKVDLAATSVGIGVKAGARKPDIATLDAFVRELKACRSLAVSRMGASGEHFRKALETLGLTDEIAPKMTVIHAGFTGELVADGRTEWAVQQMSELAVVAGVDLVGPLPDGIGSTTMFSGGVLTRAANAPAAQALVDFLASPDNAERYAKAGLEAATAS